MGIMKILVLLGVLSGIGGPTLATQRDVMERTLPAYTVALAAETLDSSTCREELLLFREAVDRRILWALRVLDASGDPKSGFIYGNNFWLGSRNQCYDAFSKEPFKLAAYIQQNNSRFRNPKEESSPVELRYFVAHAKHNSTLQYHIRVDDEDTVTLGLCLPASCSTSDISGILKRIFHNRTLLVGELYSIDLKLVEVRDLQDDHRWLLNGKIIFFATIVIVLLLLMIAGTAYDIAVHQKRLRMLQNAPVVKNNNTTAEVKCNSGNSEEAVVLPNQRSPTLAENMLMCFSVYTNTIKLFDPTIGNKSVPCIHGIKVIGMVWIIMTHGVLFICNYTDNKSWIWRYHDNFLTLFLTNATYSVDTFLFLGGFLLAYTYWAETNGSSKKRISASRRVQQLSLMLVKRYLRLTPVYILLLGFHQVNALWYSKMTVFDMSNRQHEICDKYWWRNIFYINNLFDKDSMCMLWSWYLAVDMQFYVLVVLLINLSSVFFYTAAFILGFLLIGSMLISGYISYSIKFIFTFDEEFNTLDTLYDKPWMRFGPYAVGVIMAYGLLKHGRDIHLNKKIELIGWCLSCICNLAIICSVWNTTWTVLSSAFYMALCRTGWGLGTAWVVFACYTNNAGIVNKFLSFKGFVPLSRLTFCAYLLNPFIIQSAHLFGESSIHIDVLTIGLTCFGLIMASYLAAYILCLMIEMPSVLLMNILTKPRDHSK